MTVSSQIARNDYNGNGVTTQFQVTFRFLENAHLKVLRTVIATGITTTLTLNGGGGDGYTVVGAKQPSGGQVTLNVAAPIGTRISILRNVPITQETDYIANDPFPAETHEQALDKLTMVAQQQAEITGRAIVLPAQSVGVSTELPGPVPLNLLRWNAAGTALENGVPPEIATVAPGAVVDATVSPIAAIQSTKLDFIQAGGGAAHRTVQAKLRDVVSVKDFGAVGDGITDDSAAFNAAIAASYSVYVPPGVYYINANLVNSNKPLDFFGSGIGSTTLNFGPAVTVGLLHECLVFLAPLTVREMTYKSLRTIATPQGVGAVGIAAQWAETFLNRADIKSVITNMQFGGSNPANVGWAQCLIFTQGQNVIVSNCTFTGQPTVDGALAIPADKTRSSAGIIWQGGVYPTEFKVTDCFFYNFYQGILSTGAPEGLYFKGVTCVDCGYGININVTTFSPGIGGGSAKFRPLLNIDGCHFSCWFAGVSSDGFIQSFIHDNLFYAPANAGQNSVCLNINYAGAMHVHDNVFVQFTNGGFTAQAVVINNSNGVFLSGNEFAVGFNECVRLGPVASNCRLYKNTFNGSTITADVVDNGSNNFTGSRGCLYSNTGSPSIPNGAATNVAFDAQAYDSDGLGSPGGSTITIPAGKGIRRVRLSASGVFNANGSGIRDASITKNGSASYAGSPVSNQMTASASGGSGFNMTSSIIPVVPGDVFCLTVFQNSGGALGLTPGRTSLSLEVID